MEAPMKAASSPCISQAELKMLTTIPTPVVIIPDYNPNANRPIISQGLVTAHLVNEAAKFTLKSFHALRYEGQFLAGLIAFLTPDKGGPLRGLSNMLGLAAMALAPILGIKSLVIGGGGALLGAAATTASAVALVGEVAIKAGVNYALAPNESVKTREDLTQRFIQRMEEGMKDMLPRDKQFYKQNMSYLVNMAVLQVAFLSRKQANDCLQVSGQPFPRERVATLDKVCQEYFNDIIGMKLALQNMNEVMTENNDDHAWEILKRDLCNFDETNIAQMPPKTHEAIDNLVFAMYTFSKRLDQDPVYTRLIRASSIL